MITRLVLVVFVCLMALLVSSCGDSTTTSAVVEEAAMTSGECSEDRGCRDTSTTSPATTTTTTTTTTSATTTTAESCYGDYVRKYPDLLAVFNALGGGQNINVWGKTHYNKYGVNEARSACLTTTTTTTTATTTTGTLPPGDYQYLCKHNECSEWGGRTMRWRSSAISVYSPNSILYTGVKGSWPVDFNFTSNRVAQIKLDWFYGSHCGVAYPERWTDGTIRGCRVFIHFLHQRMDCGSLQGTVKHEIGHCIGFFEHTSDGGLMDPIANNAIAPNAATRNMIRLLYSLPVGTNITSRLRSYSREGGMKYEPDRPKKLPTKAYY